MLIEHLEILDRDPSSDVKLFYNSSLFISNTILDAWKLENVSVCMVESGAMLGTYKHFYIIHFIKSLLARKLYSSRVS